VLTVADIRAVGPGVWTAWKAALLRELYNAAEDVLTGGLASGGGEYRINSAKDKLRAALAERPAVEIEDHITRGFPAYWLSFPSEAHVRHEKLIRYARNSEKPLAIETRIDRYRGVTEITTYAADQPGLFSQIAGSLAISGVNIVDAKIVTMTDGMALDTFWIQDRAGGPVTRTDQLEKITASIERTLADEVGTRIALERLMSSHRTRGGRIFDVAPRVIIDNAASQTHTVVEVNGRDRPGLLYALTLALTGQDVQIASAQIATFGANAVDVFYIKDVFGLKIGHAAKLDQIRSALMDALSSVAPPIAASKVSDTAHARAS